MNLTTRFLNNFSQWHEVALTTIKAIIAIGILCLVAYLLTIGYIPSEISFGDTLIFLLIFIALGVWNPQFFKFLFGAAYIPSLIMALWATYMSRDALENKLNNINYEL